MERLRKTGLAFVIIGAGFLGMVSAQSAPTGVAGSGPEPVAAEALADWAHRLCAVIEEGAQLLAEHHLAPADGQARAALLESLIRTSEPSVVFLDETELATRTQRLSEREWDTGLVLVALEEGLPKVAAVRTNSPAAAAGIQPGEWIEQVAGRSLQTGAALSYVRELLAEGDEAALEIGVRSVDEVSRAVTVERQRSEATSLTTVEELPADMGYMRAAGIFPGAGAEIAAALAQWRETGIFGAILDLRGAAGMAEFEIPAAAAGYVPAGTVLYAMTDRQGHELTSIQAPAPAVSSLPLMVLVDEDTTGAAELLAAVLGGGVKGAMIIGRPTAGDPMIREPVKLSTGRYALLATRQLKVGDGTIYAGTGGITPDVLITEAALNETVYEPDAPALRPGKTLSDEEKEDKALRDRTRNDTYLRRATDVLLGLKALGYARFR
ncbi:MAG: hypothetical protein KBC66_07925 [Kiritimatiellae bacterium]|jgi:carboxyl-terminal processing protease|nr:hypothetical protein [Kiritimatiellia bacterium]NLD90859.1 hypothetical protein [Lentisphaerota bacterium]HOU21147.1 S41 family peptidase [Kiritimatiellia bacterium]HPC20145.1 S41 family peptidase [Kiritimatiellia bacterium]HQN80321.1 S41 family peptidase [Kiritimatiellia bacterium]